MFANTAYEAFYTYLGLFMHSASIDIITSQKFLLAIIVLIFGTTFLFFAWNFLSGYMPGILIKKRAIPLSAFMKLIACLFIGMNLLHVGSHSSVTNYARVSWHNNPYIQSKSPGTDGDFKVSFIFDILSRSANEVSGFLVDIIDKLFAKTNSEKSAPSYFYKAIMYAGSDNIDDPNLREKIRFYTEECFKHVIPVISAEYGSGQTDGFFRPFPEVDKELRKIPINESEPNGETCYDVKNEVVTSLHKYAEQKTGALPEHQFGEFTPLRNETVHKNHYAAQALVNYFYEQKEDWLGLQKEARATGIAGRIFQVWHRFWSYDGLLSIFGNKDLQGANLHAERSNEFSDLLQRAPHLSGIAKMLLIMLFPWLVFFLAAGKWRPVIAWYVIYCSVLLWAPIWTLFYHISTSIALSTDVMSRFGELSDGISMYAADLITSRLYNFYSIYSWIQILSGPLPTVILAYKFMPWIIDKAEENSPALFNDAVSVASSTLPGGGVLKKFR